MRIGQGGAAKEDKINQFLADDAIGNGGDAKIPTDPHWNAHFLANAIGARPAPPNRR